jgi:hypothetical protein
MKKKEDLTSHVRIKHKIGAHSLPTILAALAHSINQFAAPAARVGIRISGKNIFASPKWDQEIFRKLRSIHCRTIDVGMTRYKTVSGGEGKDEEAVEA